MHISHETVLGAYFKKQQKAILQVPLSCPLIRWYPRCLLFNFVVNYHLLTISFNRYNDLKRRRRLLFSLTTSFRNNYVHDVRKYLLIYVAVLQNCIVLNAVINLVINQSINPFPMFTIVSHSIFKNNTVYNINDN